MPRNTNDFKTKLIVIHRRIAHWYKLHGRHHLPWRQKSNPYHVYISEVMLQQTQVKTVLDQYYFPFLERFPTLAALAETPVQDVLKAWEGLGYYTRARNLHAAAQQVMKGVVLGMEESFTTTSEQGRAQPHPYFIRGHLSVNYTLPDSVDGLLALPGIGRNTAHAVACFGFGVAVPVMEANVKRVLARMFAMKALDEKILWQHAETLLNRKNAFDYNQAMMDIGSLLCTKKNPRCGECPLAEICIGKATPESYPAAKAAKQTKVRERIIIVFQNAQGWVFVQKRTTKFLGGLWGFVEYEAVSNVPKAKFLGQVRQTYSHFTLEAKAYLVDTPPRTVKNSDNACFVPVAELSRLPLSRADAKVAALLAAYHAQMRK